MTLSTHHVGEGLRASGGDLAQSQGLSAASGLFLGSRAIKSCMSGDSLPRICGLALPGGLASAGIVCLAVGSLLESRRCVLWSVHPDPEEGGPKGQERSLTIRSHIFWFCAGSRLWSGISTFRLKMAA